jgi:hypothetical protein
MVAHTLSAEGREGRKEVPFFMEFIEREREREPVPAGQNVTFK